MRAAVFCGTFDPFTLGHLDIVDKASKIFDKIYVAVPTQLGKGAGASIEARIKIARASLENCPAAEVVSFSGLLTDFCSALKVFQLIRGVRNATDFVYESDLIKNYKTQCPAIECAYFFPSAGTEHISSSIVRELAKHGGNIQNHVSKNALPLVEQAYRP